jgi:aspartate aminotransferase
MTGWRLGWMVAPEAVAKAAGSLQGQQTSNAASLSQYAALAALRGSQDCVEEMRAEFERRRNFIIPALAEVPDVKIGMPGGAFYAFPEISAYLDGRFTYRGEPVEHDMQLAMYLLEEALISVVPGSAFGADGYLRFSFATSLDQIAEGVRRFGEALAAG